MATTIKATKVKASNPQVKEAKVKKVKKVEHPEAKIVKKKKQIAKEITPVTNTALMEQVVSKREIKYIYPEDCIDTLARKQFRQKVRNKIRAMENQLFKLKDQSSKEYIKIAKELKAYQNANVKDGVAI